MNQLNVIRDEALDTLHLAKEDKAYLTESPDGFRLTPYSPQFEVQMDKARTIMKKRRDVVRALAK